jgi:arylsulfatase A-like enzyme/Flp pilus assembly protein TadD
MYRVRAAIAAVLLLTAPPVWASDVGREATDRSKPTDLVLITFDTTRRDAIGVFGGPPELTPNFDALAADGVRYLRAVAPSPLTLPSHATILTGLDPPQHGVRTNGTSALPSSVPTLASLLNDAGYATAAFVGSKVLDRRFGLDRGFDHYGDAMLAENTGEYGYPERPADAVTDEALAWLGTVSPDRPFFVWIHYYDPHAPYRPPVSTGGGAEVDAYRGEVAFADREMGRLLAAVRARSSRVVVAVTADHGEALGEHGERTHGVFVYTPTIEVPLVISGPGVAAGARVSEPVAIARLGATLLELLLTERTGVLPGTPLPLNASEAPVGRPVYSESMMPSVVYGWSPLHAVTVERWRFIEAPMPELYDLSADPEETTNLAADRPDVVEAMRGQLAELMSRPAPASAEAPDLDAETRAALVSLGYLEGGTSGRTDAIDPKDGMALLGRFERAKELLAAGEADKAAVKLAALVEQNPANLPFVNRLAEAQLAAGRGDEALTTQRRALELAPTSEFVNLAYANALFRLDRREQARQGYRATLGINPRSAPAWLGLAALSSGPEDEREVLGRAMESGVESLLVVLRAAQLDREAGHLEAAEGLLNRADALVPGMAAVRLERARVLQDQGRLEDALDACRRAASIEPGNPHTALCTGRVYLAMDQPGRARPHLLRATVLGKDTAVEIEARTLIESIDNRLAAQP